jgi:peroxiredoxin
MKRFILGFTALAAVLGGLLTAVPARAGEMPAKFKVGDKAPDFTLADLEGQKVQLSSVLKNKAVLLAFWSRRCSACQQEVPALERIHKNSQGKPVAVISVVTDGMPAAETRSVMKDVGIAPTYPVLLDPEFAVSDTYTNFVVPHTLVIDRTGTIRYVHTGFEQGTDKQYEAALQAALGS